MTTATQTISRSLRLLGVLDPVTPASAEDIATALPVLNALVTRWEANGLALGWANVSSASATLPIPPEADEAVAYNLACRLAPEYGVSVVPEVMTYARDELACLRRDRLVSAPLTVRSDLPSSHSWWNITTDEPA